MFLNSTLSTTPRLSQSKDDTPELAEARALVTRFYDCFARLDAQGMNACLHPEISFSDPVFPNLRGPQVASMWSMLMASAARHPEAFQLKYEFVFLEERKAQVHWQASYLYGGSRQVRNKVLATMSFWDGKIVRHVDGFNFYAWSKQALGLSALVLGWHAKYRSAVQAAAGKQLSIFMGQQRHE